MSHLAWVNSLPESWQVKPLRATTDCVVSNVDKLSVDYEIPVRLCNYTDVYNNDFIFPNLDFMQATATEDEIGKFGLRVGDVVITKDSESWDDIGVPALVRETADDLVCGYHLALLRPRLHQLLAGEFLFRCLQAKPIQVQLELAANGVTRFGLPKSKIGTVILPVPPLPTQRSIADYLDRETARLDGLLEEKERLVELLAEKRRGLITRAVTRGLDPNVSLRDSGISWLGEIPEHWYTVALKRVASLKSGEFISSSLIDAKGDYPVFGGNGKRGYSSSYTHDGEHVLIGRQGALCGNINYATGRFWASEHAVVVTADEKCLVRWLGEILDIMHLNQYSQSAAQPGLAVEFIENLKIPVPPIPEQRTIVEFCAGATTRLGNLRELTVQTIGLLKERRAALIAAAVTGQNDTVQVA